RLEDGPEILRSRYLVEIERLSQAGLVIQRTEAGVRKHDVILLASAGRQLGEHVLIGVPGDTSHRDASRLVKALLDLRIDVVLPRHHDHRAAISLAGGREIGKSAERQSGAGRAFKEDPTRDPRRPPTADIRLRRTVPLRSR